ncbi:MAG: exopolyphosphatase [Nitrospirae bacterium]|nr:exopolyphosphatase [Nitrospirota bacterium]
MISGQGLAALRDRRAGSRAHRRGTGRSRLTGSRLARVASLDLGTNTFRALIADAHGAQLAPVKVLHRITRLGQDLHRRSTFHPDAVRRSLAAADAFHRAFNSAGVTWTGGIATEAFRRAGDGPRLLEELRERHGWDVRIVPAQIEASFALRGVAYGLGRRRRPYVLIDIGGGSTEFIRADAATPKIMTTPLGVVRLTERYLNHDPPRAGEIAALIRAVDGGVGAVRRRLGGGVRALVGTAGTVTTLAAMKLRMRNYEASRITGTELGRSELEGMFSELAGVGARRRLHWPGMERGREDLILAGIAILTRTLERFDLQTLTVCDAGILEGILLERRLFTARARR